MVKLNLLGPFIQWCLFCFGKKKHVWVGFAGESWGDSFFLGSCCGRARNLVNKKRWSSEEWMKSTDKIYIYIFIFANREGRTTQNFIYFWSGLIGSWCSIIFVWEMLCEWGFVSRLCVFFCSRFPFTRSILLWTANPEGVHVISAYATRTSKYKP